MGREDGGNAFFSFLCEKAGARHPAVRGVAHCMSALPGSITFAAVSMSLRRLAYEISSVWRTARVWACSYFFT